MRGASARSMRARRGDAFRSGAGAWPCSRLPFEFTMRRLILGCAGDARLVFVETSAAGRRVRTLSLVSVEPRVYTELIDIPMNGRRSSLVVPATGPCAQKGDQLGGIGAESRDQASAAP